MGYGNSNMQRISKSLAIGRNVVLSSKPSIETGGLRFFLLLDLGKSFAYWNFHTIFFSLLITCLPFRLSLGFSSSVISCVSCASSTPTSVVVSQSLRGHSDSVDLK